MMIYLLKESECVLASGWSPGGNPGPLRKATGPIGTVQWDRNFEAKIISCQVTES